jgi:hypothetical protein
MTLGNAFPSAIAPLPHETYHVFDVNAAVNAGTANMDKAL